MLLDFQEEKLVSLYRRMRHLRIEGTQVAITLWSDGSGHIAIKGNDVARTFGNLEVGDMLLRNLQEHGHLP